MKDVTHTYRALVSRDGDIEFLAVAKGARPSWRRYDASAQGNNIEVRISRRDTNPTLSIRAEEWYDTDEGRRIEKVVFVGMNVEQSRALYEVLKTQFEPSATMASAKLVWKLFDANDKEVKVGDSIPSNSRVSDVPGTVKVLHLEPPHREGVSGRVETDAGRYYVTVYGLHFKQVQEA